MRGNLFNYHKLIFWTLLGLFHLRSFAEIGPKIDPIRFSIGTDASQIAVNEEFKITITARYVGIPSNTVFVFEGANSFRLKLILPDGFVKTGGNFVDFAGTELNSSKSEVTYTLLGKFTSSVKNGTFQLLRSHKNSDNWSHFIEVGRLNYNNTQTFVENSGARIMIASTPGFVPYMGIAQLRSGFADTAKVVYLNNGLASGLFRLDTLDSTSPDDSVMVIRFGTKRFKREYSGYLNVQWWGAKGDGITDDVDAIQRAINFSGKTGWAGTMIDTYKRAAGSVVYLPPSKGYRITKTLRLPAYVHLLGDAQGGFWFDGLQKASSTIIPDFSNQLSWAIEADVYKSGGVKLAYGEVVAGSSIDSVTCTTAHGITISNINISVPEGKRLYGGIKMVAAIQSKVLNCYVRGTDIGYLFSAAWGAELNSRSETIKAGVVLKFDCNGFTLNGYYDAMAGIPLPETAALFNFLWSGGSLTDYSAKKIGISNWYSNGVGSQNLTTEHWDIGLCVISGDFNINALYVENNSIAAVTGYACNTNIGHMTGANNGITLIGGDGMKGSLNSISNISFTASLFHSNTAFYVNPESVKFYTSGLRYRGDQNTIYVKSTGSDSNHGFLSHAPVATLNAALKRITDNYDFVDNRKNPIHGGNFTIHFLDNEAYDVTGAILLNNVTLNLVGIESSKPTINVSSSSVAGRIELTNCKVTASNILFSKNQLDHGEGRALFWSTRGTNDISLNYSTVTLDLGGSIVYPNYSGASIVNLSLYLTNVTGPSTSSIIQNNYTNARPHLITYIRTGGLLTGGIETVANDGVLAPSAWVVKKLVTP